VIRNFKYALRAGAVVAVMALPVALLQAQETDTKATKVRQVQPCSSEADYAAVSQLVASIRSAVSKLPPTKSSDQDIEAAIVYAISQVDACPAVVRAALSTVSGEGTPAFMRSVAAVTASYGRSGGGTGTAGVRVGWGGSYAGNSSFSAPVVGVGGGSANYTPS